MVPRFRAIFDRSSSEVESAHRVATLNERFEAQVDRFGSKVAVQDGRSELTYEELDRRANAVAGDIMEADPGSPFVGLCVGRSVDLVVGIVGILKAGFAYVPIDPSHPDRRVALLAEDSGIDTIVVDGSASGRSSLASLDRVVVGAGERPEAPRVSIGPADLAYLIYTSGTTGRPKGTLVSHHNVCRLFDSSRELFEFDDTMVWSLFHSASFDFSVWEMWGALLYGGRLVVVPESTVRSPAALVDLLESEQVTMLSLTPSAFMALSPVVVDDPSRNLGSLSHVVFGGEKLHVAALGPWIDRFGVDDPQLVNMYGITETTVHVSYRRIGTSDLKSPASSPIGLPLPDLTVHLMDGSGHPVGDGEVGEMVISGPGVAGGYLGHPELTADRFPWLALGADGAEVRCYRSGDLACRVNGELFYQGRADDQLKIRGFRIEPHEVESHLLGSSEIAACAVVGHVQPDGDQYLIAYVVPSAGGAAGSVATIERAVAERARSQLPTHLRPGRVVVVDHLPLTINGKVDRPALSALRGGEAGGRGSTTGSQPSGGTVPTVGADGADPVGPSRESPGANGMDGSRSSIDRLQALACDIFPVPDMRPDLDLFEQGATSLALARLLTEVLIEYGLELAGPELAGDVSLDNLARLIDQHRVQEVSR